MTDKELDKWCRANWDKIPAEKRKACLDHLRGWIPIAVLREWKRSGFGDAFHMFGGGMQIRNRLRDIIKDADLPPVQYDLGPARNWDDYYTGALQELLESV